jgi:hypothetical protein
MLKRYFEVFDDVSLPGRWELVRGAPVSPPSGILHIPLCQPGSPLEFSFLVGGPVPVVGPRLAEVLETLAPGETQLFPARIESQDGPYYVVNVARTARCIDDRLARQVKLWRPEDGQPEEVGQYRNVRGMRIEPARAGEAMIFRPWGWTVALVVSDELKDAMERVGATGARFSPV